ncbi:hypothetical protein [Bradyrhizobium centrolobii]|uniref:hypothetical protein n=1 Tax=Bradyrhizobium centrolobii TaxID=1505087 RepID=UPI0026B3DB45
MRTRCPRLLALSRRDEAPDDRLAGIDRNLPFLLSLVSPTTRAMAPCLLASVLAVLLSGEPHRAATAWCVGMLIAAVAVRARLRTI